jgi:iron complex transport system permease protein
MLRRHPYIINLAILIVAFVFSIGLGAVYIPPGTIFCILIDSLPVISLDGEWTNSFIAIINAVRLPHTVLVALTGAALASSGAAYQGLFRNPLADPYLIGVASGAGLVLSLRSGARKWCCATDNPHPCGCCRWRICLRTYLFLNASI